MLNKEKDNISKIQKAPDTVIIEIESEKKKTKLIKKSLHFLGAFIISLIYTYIIYKFFRKLSVSEIISLNNKVSFPLKDLYINITSKPGIIGTLIIYIKNNQKMKQEYLYKQSFINVSSVLNDSEIILEDEFKDYLLFFFFGSSPAVIEDSDSVVLINGIYSINMTEGDNKNVQIEQYYRRKTFNIKKECSYASKDNGPRIYEYYVQSHSIKTLNEEYNFPVIDDYGKNFFDLSLDYNQSFTYLYFGIQLKKKIFLDSFEIIGESCFDIWWKSLGTIVAIFEFTLLLLVYLFERRSLRGTNPKNKKLLKDNESMPKAINEMNDINQDIM